MNVKCLSQLLYNPVYLSLYTCRPYRHVLSNPSDQ